MHRHALDKFKIWRSRPRRAPLLVRGARQVGKTWLIREFGKGFAGFVELNLEARTETHAVFRELFGKPRELIAALSLIGGVPIIPGKTLLFLDEIQAVKEALLALRYFKEELPELHVIGAGSLLEFTIREISFPVGRIDIIYLFPLNFEEFLGAQNRQDLAAVVNNLADKPLPEAVHRMLLEQVAMYCLVGGMPEAVDAFFADGRDWNALTVVLRRLAGTFREDFYKYAARARVEHLRLVFDACPRLVGEKFKYVNVSSGHNARELGQALSLLCDAGLFYKAHHTTAAGLPLRSGIRPSHFKVFCLDLGLANCVAGMNFTEAFLGKTRLFAQRGGLAEQLVAQEWVSYTPTGSVPELFYWHREAKSANAEVDILVQKDARVIPIEVKAGRSRTGKSLAIFLREKNALVTDAVVTASDPWRVAGGVRHVPLYALMNVFRGDG